MFRTLDRFYESDLGLCTKLKFYHGGKKKYDEKDVYGNAGLKLAKVGFPAHRLTHFMPLIFFDIPSENIRKPEVFSCFQGVSKEIDGMK